MSIRSPLVVRREDRIRRRSRNGAPRDRLTASATVSMCWNVAKGRDDWMPAVPGSARRLPRFCAAKPGAFVWAISSTSRLVASGDERRRRPSPRHDARHTERGGEADSSPSRSRSSAPAVALDRSRRPTSPAFGPPMCLARQPGSLADFRAPCRVDRSRPRSVGPLGLDVARAAPRPSAAGLGPVAPSLWAHHFTGRRGRGSTSRTLTVACREPQQRLGPCRWRSRRGQPRGHAPCRGQTGPPGLSAAAGPDVVVSSPYAEVVI